MSKGEIEAEGGALRRSGEGREMKYQLCPECNQPMLPKGTRKKPDEYDHASGCPYEGKTAEQVRHERDGGQG